MNASDDTEWTPRPELLAAYADGEFEGRDKLEPLRRRLEAWLARHSHAQEELAQYRTLRRLWLASTPREPAGNPWPAMQARLERLCGPCSALREKSSAGRWVAAYLGVAASLVLAGLVWNALRIPVPRDQPNRNGPSLVRATDDLEPFPVATEAEIVILRVEGQDTPSVVVGQLPLQGPLEVAAREDVTVTSVQPHGPNNMVPTVHGRGPGAPLLLWAITDSEKTEP